MDNLNDKLSNEEQSQPSCLGAVMPSLQPFTGEMWSFLLINALRCLTEEQIAGLCFDLYCRNELTDSIDKKIEMLKLERKGNGA
jgi:hypothetical protein